MIEVTENCSNLNYNNGTKKEKQDIIKQEFQPLWVVAADNELQCELLTLNWKQGYPGQLYTPVHNKGFYLFQSMFNFFFNIRPKLIVLLSWGNMIFFIIILNITPSAYSSPVSGWISHAGLY